MKTLTAYCVSKRKKVTIKKVKQVWKTKSKNHYLYLLEGEATGCDTSVWRAVSEDDAKKIAKDIGKPIKLRKSTKKKKKEKKRTKSKAKAKPKKRKTGTRKGMVRKTARRAYTGLKKRKRKTKRR